MSTPLTPQQRMCQAIGLGDGRAVRKALADGANPNRGPLGTETSYYPLARACEKASQFGCGPHALESVRTLLESGADPTKSPGYPQYDHLRDSKIFGLLANAIGMGTRESDRVLDLLLLHWPDTISWKATRFLNGGRGLAHLASETDREQTLEILVRHGADLDIRDNMGNTPLMAAGHGKKARALVMMGAEPYAYNHMKQTALWRAVGTPQQAVRKEIIHALLDLDHDLTLEVKRAVLARRVAWKLEKWQRHWPKEDREALVRLDSAFRRMKLEKQAGKQRKGDFGSGGRALRI